MKSIISSVKGTRDFYPESMALRTWLYNTLRSVAERFGYQEWEAPILESIDLYAAKSGDELVNQQAFVFNDRGGDPIALRPELTPSLARLVAQRQNQLVFPLRWWSYGPFWRYERPQRGRTREFFQWNVDLIGVDTPESDAEMIAIAAMFFREVGLTPDKVEILVNDRQMTASCLGSLGVPQEKWVEVLGLIDRRSKMKAEDWDLTALDTGLNEVQLAGLKTYLADDEQWRKSETLVRVFTAASEMGVGDYLRYDPNVIRGLLYYTSTVFEAYALNGDIRRAILGGGRYDNLMSQVGGDPLPAVGFAMGDVIIMLLLEAAGLLPADLGRSTAKVFVTVFDQERQSASMRLAAELRAAGINVVCATEPAKLPKQFKFADRMGIQTVVVIGPDEAANGMVTIKDLKDGSQDVVRRDALIDKLNEMLGNSS